jgi:hypothetical protein
MSKFYESNLFCYYINNGIGWFRFFKLRISFKHINKCEFKNNNPKGFFVGYWLVCLT